MPINLSIFGALSLLGQHLIARLIREPGLKIASLHDHRHDQSLNAVLWFADTNARNFTAGMPIKSPLAVPEGDLILSH
ncbi:hypothetical protein [Paracoccus sp. JM45]|uniref:hypothetical protein n=1 Tax=Paracoccus sp. JM45 TaxID=2283626 RepID=UPI000E6D058A|nr:hypothetical protein [Paracoccus sp. JM45]RJE79066.1 hypothetical protein DWB67_14030 [Paracoccus sp. JM45]